MKRQVLSNENLVDQADEYILAQQSYGLPSEPLPSSSPVINMSEEVTVTTPPSLNEPVLSNTMDDSELDRVRKTSITSGSTDGDSHSLSHLLHLHTLHTDTVHSPIAEEGLCLDDL